MSELKTPILKSRVSNGNIMKIFMNSLIILSIVAVFMQFIHNGIPYGIKSILLLLVSTYVAYESELFAYTHLFDKVDRIEAKAKAKLSYPMITGLLLGLMLPIGTPLWVAAVGSFVSIFIGKMIFGGYSKNIFNPALVGRLFLMLAWPALLGYVITDTSGDFILVMLFNIDVVDVISSPTLGTAISDNLFNNNINELLFGGTNGAIGEINRFAIIVIMIFLLIKKIIDPRIVFSILGTVLFMFMVIYHKEPNFHLLALSELLLGGLLFGVTFIATDPVTSPSTIKGRYIFGIGIGIIIVLIRTIGSWPEGVLFAILFMNMLTPLINDMTSKINTNKYKTIVSIVLAITVITFISLYLGTKL